jgi:hypothetical protein
MECSKNKWNEKGRLQGKLTIDEAKAYARNSLYMTINTLATVGYDDV